MTDVTGRPAQLIRRLPNNLILMSAVHLVYDGQARGGGRDSLSRLLKEGFQVPETAPFGVRSDVESIICERSPLSGLLYCAHCGVAMVASYTKKAGRRYRDYICLRAQQRGWKNCPTGEQRREAGSLASSCVFDSLDKCVVLRKANIQPGRAFHHGRQQVCHASDSPPQCFWGQRSLVSDCGDHKSSPTKKACVLLEPRAHS